MPTQKRERKRAGHQARQAAIAAARRRQARRTRAIAGVFLALVLVAGVAVVVGGGGDDDQEVATTDTTVGPGETPNSTTAAKKPVELPPVPGGASSPNDGCPPTDGSAARTTTFAKPPPPCVDVAKTYQAEINTTKGLVVVDLDVKNATKTVNNFVVLSRYKFYEGVAFHRIVPGFVIQGGDPQQTGTGGPGYKFEDELPKPGSYKIGSLAMANSGPSTNGSQFFIVTGDAGTSLPPQYSLFGQVSAGLEVVKAIEETGIPGTQDGKPSEVVKINSITIKET